MRRLRQFAFFSTIATYVLIFIGGLVRVSGAGLGCPDWPTCFGRWIPPTSLDQLPPDIDPSQFNIVLAWIEYSNRLCGMLVGLLIAATAVLALIYARKHLRIWLPAAAAGLLTAFQGWQGSVVVSSMLEPVIVTVHTVLALVIVSLLIWVTQQAYYEERKDEKMPELPAQTVRWMTILWIMAIVQIILGTQLRQAYEVVVLEFPMLHATEWFGKVGGLNHIHMTLGIIVAIFAWYVGRSILKGSKGITPLLKQSVVGIMVAVGVQITLGLTFIIVGLSPLMQIFHLWVASIIIGLSLVIFSASKRAKQVRSN